MGGYQLFPDQIPSESESLRDMTRCLTKTMKPWRFRAFDQHRNNLVCSNLILDIYIKTQPGPLWPPQLFLTLRCLCVTQPYWITHGMQYMSLSEVPWEINQVVPVHVLCCISTCCYLNFQDNELGALPCRKSRGQQKQARDCGKNGNKRGS